MTLSYRTIKEEIEAGHYTVKRALEIIGVQHARQQITDDEYTELHNMAAALGANSADDEAAIWRTQVERRLNELEETVGQLLEDSGETDPDPDTPDGSAAINDAGFMPDIAILDGGWNDLMLGTPIGTVDFNQFVLTWGESTILEMMETMFYQFRNLFPSIAVIYFVMYKIQPFSSETTMPGYIEQRDFVENVKLLCDKYGVTCVDFWDNSCIVPDIEANHVKYMADFLHINEAGYRAI